jgi:hypothetical protein
VDNPFLIYYILLAGMADSPWDLLTLVEPDGYFQSRGIETTAARLEEIARTRPDDGKTQAAQLLAIRWLGEHRVAGARETLLAIAGGRLAQDRHGFARDYARRALAALDGRCPERARTAENSLREALQWFPEDVVAVAALDLGVSWANKPFGTKAVLVSTSPGRPPEPMVVRPSPFPQGGCGDRENDPYRWTNHLGNVRVLRVAVAVLPPAPAGGKPGVLVRCTGLWDHQRLVEHLRQEQEISLVREEAKAPADRITLLRARDGSMLAVVGDTDLIFGESDLQGEDLAAVEQALEVRAGRKASVLRGPLAADLREVPVNASGLYAGQVDQEVIGPPLAKHFGIPHVPHHLVLHATVDETGSIDVGFRGLMRTPEEARAFTESIRESRDRALASLGPSRPTGSAVALSETLNSITTADDGASVSGKARVSGDLPQALTEWALGQLLVPLFSAMQPFIVAAFILEAVCLALLCGGIALGTYFAVRAVVQRRRTPSS